MPMTEQHWNALARYLREIVPRAAPDWTTSNSHDPGITVLEVLNYALTDLQLRQPLDESARALAAAVAGQATALAQAYGANAPRIDPYQNFKFRVKWDGRYVAGVSHVSALRRTTDIVEYREGGATPYRGAYRERLGTIRSRYSAASPTIANSRRGRMARRGAVRVFPSRKSSSSCSTRAARCSRATRPGAAGCRNTRRCLISTSRDPLC